jgi:lipopolysaccharide transport system ATP-binding protein
MLDLSKRDIDDESKDQDVVLSIKNVSKRFCRDLKRSLLYGVQDIAGEIFGSQRQEVKLRKEEFWALKDVNLELRRGEALGLVGANGAGKTTLLKIISGLIAPDHGSVEVKGRLAPLIALGAGFNPILTGRENIYVNMSILGLSKQETEDRFDEVVEFAEISEAIDSPVQSYSSGMAARLGFACAIHTEPDILLIDEVLAVGDIKFRGKCHRKLHMLREKGLSLILVSHGTYTVLSVCNRSIYLKKGKMIISGDSKLVVNQYEKDLFIQNTLMANATKTVSEKSEVESLGVDIISVNFKDKNNKKVGSLKTGEKTTISIVCKSYREYSKIGLILVIKSLKLGGETILILDSFHDEHIFKLSIGKTELQVAIPCLCLQGGMYLMDVFVKYDFIYTLDSIDSFSFTVDNDQYLTSSLFYQPRIWEVETVED